MGTFQIKCINLSSSEKKYEHITHIGDDSGKISLEEAVRRLENGDSFFVIDPKTGKRAEVLIFPINGKKFLRTKADGIWGDNLLALPLCP